LPNELQIQRVPHKLGGVCKIAELRVSAERRGSLIKSLQAFGQKTHFEPQMSKRRCRLGGGNLSGVGEIAELRLPDDEGHGVLD
jgi:hypothetical protein